MELTDILSPGNVVLGLKAQTKQRVLETLSFRAAAAAGLDEQTLLSVLTQREELGSTGMGGGIAIPHARLTETAAPFGVLAKLKGPIPFAAVDDQPVDLVFLLLLPIGSAGEHLNALAKIARQLRNPAVTERMRNARDESGLYAAFVGPAA